MKSIEGDIQKTCQDFTIALFVSILYFLVHKCWNNHWWSLSLISSLSQPLLYLPVLRLWSWNLHIIKQWDVLNSTVLTIPWWHSGNVPPPSTWLAPTPPASSWSRMTGPTSSPSPASSTSRGAITSRSWGPCPWAWWSSPRTATGFTTGAASSAPPHRPSTKWALMTDPIVTTCIQRASLVETEPGWARHLRASLWSSGGLTATSTGSNSFPLWPVTSTRWSSRMGPSWWWSVVTSSPWMRSSPRGSGPSCRSAQGPHRRASSPERRWRPPSALGWAPLAPQRTQGGTWTTRPSWRACCRRSAGPEPLTRTAGRPWALGPARQVRRALAFACCESLSSPLSPRGYLSDRSKQDAVCRRCGLDPWVGKEMEKEMATHSSILA